MAYQQAAAAKVRRALSRVPAGEKRQIVSPFNDFSPQTAAFCRWHLFCLYIDGAAQAA
jgi:hypothetical protein